VTDGHAIEALATVVALLFSIAAFVASVLTARRFLTRMREAEKTVRFYRQRSSGAATFDEQNETPKTKKRAAVR
jgi:hypothetical protein